jgi:hypothetical protein
MHVETWAPGSQPELDQLFNDLRETHHNDHSHRLWKNYSLDSFAHAGIVANTIYFDDNDVPELCSSISSRECWPAGAYRILNRAWKANNKKAFIREISDCMGQSVHSQVKWLAEHTHSQLHFVSRQTDHWDEWVIRNFKRQFNLDFATDTYKYLTCPNECDDTCWQRIIYNGNKSLLAEWKRK